MITENEKEKLFKKLLMPIHRYLWANTFEMWDGHEKAEHHRKISKILCSFLGGNKDSEDWIKIHDFTAEILTDKMDEVIGFTTERAISTSERNKLISKFFEVLIDNLKGMKKLIS